MKNKRILSLMLSFVMILGAIPVSVMAENQPAPDAVVYMTVSNQGLIEKTNDGGIMANKKVSVKDINADGVLDFDEALVAAHKEYNAEDAYSTNGGAVEKLWGVETGNVLFFINNSGLDMGIKVDTVSEGDNLVVSINKDGAPYYADWYTFFDTKEKKVDVGEEFTLNLKGHYGMAYTDSQMADVVLSDICVGIWKDGEIFSLEDKVTDEYGNITLAFSEIGTYYITASGTVRKEIINWSEYQQEFYDCPIIAPFCEVTVTDPDEITILHNIAEKYRESGVVEDENLLWLVADFAAYEKAFPEKPSVLNAIQKQAALDKIILDVSTKTGAADFAKAIIALRALGYDAKKVCTSKNEKIDIVSKLTELIDAEDLSVTNIYVLPYIIIALHQGEGYLTAEHEEYLLNAAISSKLSWQNVEWGTDGATPMVLALAPYYDTNEDVKNIIDETVEIIKNAQSDNGVIDNATSTGLAITALSAIGKNAKEIIRNEKSLIDGIMNEASGDLTGFNPMANTFSTEQGFRGLVAWQLLEKGENSRVFDFLSYPMEEAVATWAQNCPVSFSVTPNDADVKVDGVEALSNGKFDLPAGTYNYTVSKSGYETKAGSFVITEEEAKSHTAKTITVSLSENVSGGGNVSDNITVTLKVMVHDKNNCNNSYTYRNNSSKYTALVSTSIKLNKGQTVFDALVKALEEKEVEYVDKGSGYIISIGGIEEFDHSQNSGWMFTVDGEHKNTGSRQTKLTSDSTVVWFYTDDYEKEKGSDDYSFSGGSFTTTTQKDKTEEIKEEAPENNEDASENIGFSDVNKDDWYYEAVNYVTKNALMNGTGSGFAPDIKMTRAMLVTVLYRLSGSRAVFSDSKFTDIKKDAWYSDAVLWASENGIVSGMTKTLFAPDENITREQVATIFYRYANLKGYNASKVYDISKFEDAEYISDFAFDAMGWANANKLMTGTGDLTLSPKSSATRAQVATMIMRFCENINQ